MVSLNLSEQILPNGTKDMSHEKWVWVYRSLKHETDIQYKSWPWSQQHMGSLWIKSHFSNGKYGPKKLNMGTKELSNKNTQKKQCLKYFIPQIKNK